MKPARHSGHQTQWAAQFAVASELCKLGYEVALTMGNHPSVDLMVVSPEGRTQFGVDVKGLHARNHWVVKPKEKRGELFYVLALVPAGKPNRYFVLSQDEANAEIAINEEACERRARDRGQPATPGFEGIPFAAADVDAHRDAWGKLPR